MDGLPEQLAHGALLLPSHLPQAGNLEMLVRGWICTAGEDGYDCSRHPNSGDAPKDQQGWHVHHLSVGVTPTDDRAALVALHNATGGPNWGDNTNWLSDAPLGEWHGVTANSDVRVTRPYLVDNQLSCTLPPKLGNLTHLSALSLYINRLSGAIPPELGQLNRLTYLGLFNNRLSGEMPPELGNLASLRWLILGRNQLSGGIPATLGRLANLERLELSSNQLTSLIPAELGNLAELERLILSGNQLGGCIPEALSQVADNDLDALGLPFCEP